jgi:hypothetical protein
VGRNPAGSQARPSSHPLPPHSGIAQRGPAEAGLPARARSSTAQLAQPPNRVRPAPLAVATEPQTEFLPVKAVG